MQWHLAAARPNFALIKYWGKVPGSANLPAVESISATVDHLQTEVALRRLEGAAADQLWIDGQKASPARQQRLSRFVDLFRQLAGAACRVEVHSRANFPLAAGLASSASSFAALTVALAAAFGQDLSRQQLANLARQGSGSAARSVFGGLVHLRCDPLDSQLPTPIEPLAQPTDWPLQVVVATLSRREKAVGSTEGMERSRLTSPYYAAWVDSQPVDIAKARQAIARRDFAALAEVAEHSCLKMHALAHSALPPILYWAPGTWAGMQKITELRAAGVPTFFTVDAGPQLKAFCLPSAVEVVRGALSELPGVEQVFAVPLGAGAQGLPAPQRPPFDHPQVAL
jgi:diphosphomevalonate decarboxylase